jgi:hypothetical protein
MRFLTSFCFTFLIFNILDAQPVIQWQKTLGGSIIDYASSIRATNDGGYIVAGNTLSNNGNVTGNNGASDYWIVKLNAAGAVQWQKALGGGAFDEAKDIQTTPDGGYIVLGSSSSVNGQVSGNHGGSDFWVVKLDANGILQWQKSYGGTANDDARAVQTTPDGGYILAGTTYSNDGDVSGNHGNGDFWVVKIGATGTLQWQKALGGTAEDEASALQTTPDGGYIVVGETQSFNGDVAENQGIQDFWVVKLGIEGNLQWQKTLGGSSYDWAYAVQNTLDGGYIVAGSTFSNNGDVSGNHGGYDFWLVKLSSLGTLSWQKALGGSDTEEAYSVQATSDQGFVVAGYAASKNGDVSNNKGGWDYWVVKVDANGNLKWQRSYGGSANDEAKGILATEDGGFIAVGHTRSNDGDVSGNHGNFDYWVVKLSAAVSAVTDLGESIHLQMAPNPAKNYVQIQFDAQYAPLQVRIQDIQGREMWHQKISGNTLVAMESWPAGVYVVTARTADGAVAVKELVKE